VDLGGLRLESVISENLWFHLNVTFLCKLGHFSDFGENGGF